MTFLTHFFDTSRTPFITKFKAIVGGAVGALVLFGALIAMFKLRAPELAYLLAACGGAMFGYAAGNWRR